MRGKGIIFLIAFIVVVGFSLQLTAAEIIYIKGRVEVKSSGSTSWQRARTGQEVFIGDAIRTARRSGVDIALDEAKENIIRLDARTMIILNSVIPGEINRIELSEGTILASVENVAEGLGFEISTPSTVAGVRGTGLRVESRGGVDTVGAYKDDVSVKLFDEGGNLLDEVALKEGFKVLVEQFKEIGELMELLEGEREDWNDWMQELQDLLSEMGDRSEGGAGSGDITDIQEKLDDIIEGMKEQIEEQTTEDALEMRDDVEPPSTCGGSSPR